MKILLAVDGSEPALAVVRHALTLVEAGLDASFVLVNVQAPPSLYEVVVAHDAEVIERVRTAAGIDLLGSALALLAAAEVAHEVEIADGEASRTLVDLIENHACDAVFVGARGAGQPDASGIGSVTEDLLTHSPVPVTVVRLSDPTTLEGDLA